MSSSFVIVKKSACVVSLLLRFTYQNKIIDSYNVVLLCYERLVIVNIIFFSTVVLTINVPFYLEYHTVSETQREDRRELFADDEARS